MLHLFSSRCGSPLSSGTSEAPVAPTQAETSVRRRIRQLPIGEASLPNRAPVARVWWSEWWSGCCCDGERLKEYQPKERSYTVNETVVQPDPNDSPPHVTNLGRGAIPCASSEPESAGAIQMQTGPDSPEAPVALQPASKRALSNDLGRTDAASASASGAVTRNAPADAPAQVRVAVAAGDRKHSASSSEHSASKQKPLDGHGSSGSTSATRAKPSAQTIETAERLTEKVHQIMGGSGNDSQKGAQLSELLREVSHDKQLVETLVVNVLMSPKFGEPHKVFFTAYVARNAIDDGSTQPPKPLSREAVLSLTADLRGASARWRDKINYGQVFSHLYEGAKHVLGREDLVAERLALGAAPFADSRRVQSSGFRLWAIGKLEELIRFRTR